MWLTDSSLDSLALVKMCCSRCACQTARILCGIVDDESNGEGDDDGDDGNRDDNGINACTCPL